MAGDTRIPWAAMMEALGVAAEGWGVPGRLCAWLLAASLTAVCVWIGAFLLSKVRAKDLAAAP